VKYYKSLRNKILEETPFYVLGAKRAVKDEDDGMALEPRGGVVGGEGRERETMGDSKLKLIVGIVRYRDKYKPAKAHRQTLRGLPTGTLPPHPLDRT